MFRQIVKITSIAACASSLALSATAGTFTFNKIADTTDGYSNFSLPVINQSGQVAFNATLGGTAKVFSSTGGQATLAYDPTVDGITSLAGAPAINNAGHIAFAARGADATGTQTQSSVFLLQGSGHATTVFDSSQTVGNVGVSNVTVALGATSDSIYYAYQLAGNQYVLSIPGGGIPMAARYKIGSLSVSSNGIAIVTDAFQANGPLTAYETSVTPTGTRQPVANDPNNFTHGADTNFVTQDVGAYAAVNAAGSVVFSARYAADGTPTSTAAFAFYADGRSVYLTGGEGQPVAINDSNTVLAGSKVFSGTTSTPFLSVGDAFMGSTVQSISYLPNGFNNANELAFEATLANGTQGIYTVTVPEPAAIGALAIGAGAVMTRRRRRV